MVSSTPKQQAKSPKGIAQRPSSKAHPRNTRNESNKEVKGKGKRKEAGETSSKTAGATLLAGQRMNGAGPSVADAATGETYKSLSSINDSFLELLSYIPAKYYFPQSGFAGAEEEEEDDASQPGNGQLSKKERKRLNAEEQKAAKKEKAREARMAKLDPANQKSIPELQAERAAAASATVEATAADVSDMVDLDMDFEQDDGQGDDDDDEGDDNNDEEVGGAGDTDNDIEDSDDEDDSHEAQIARARKRSGDDSINGSTPAKKRHAGQGDEASLPKPAEDTSASITDLRVKLQKRIAELQSKRRQPRHGPNAEALGPNDGGGDDSGAEEGNDSTLSAKSDLLLERRRQRGEMRDRRRRERKEARRAEKEAGASAVKGKDANGAAARAAGKQVGNGSSAPALLVNENGRSSTSSKAADGEAAARLDAFNIDTNGAFTFGNVSFAGPGEGEEEALLRKKKSKHALPRDPKSALAVLEARKAKDEKRKARQSEMSSAEGDDGNDGAEDDGVMRSDDAAKWSKMMEATQGIKIRDDERMLKKAVKKKEKMKEKTKTSWSERVREVADQQAARAKKRNDNIAARKEAKLAKHKGANGKKASSTKGTGSKKKSSAKARPGFEGRAMGLKSKAGVKGRSKGKR
ncbi:hypothetical protein K437DRAFT_295943 [Tilletiaria anomala UBC 951]|uniref:SURF6-domain-containing protein n=1 Tax=Tilletiaria anomala (strain ATCC 24038 / CBS 436.72 / UBC 951) TaxID=1037660 RepID=A0A066VMM6_TILAU|nr:uncharacterized protein K437DRAFT_295943 [Tilletiaria anomala UBC 951]KDN40019.1 hypothetical protein K437DRAFT_295943 [Tilletiaria anomala UBC 951]